MDRKRIAGVLEEIAILSELAGANPFKTRAFQNGAHALHALDDERFGELLREKKLTEVDGIGKSIARCVAELADSGHSTDFERLKSEVPPGLVELRRLPGLGAKKVRLLWQKADVTDLGSLKEALASQSLRDLGGFGAKTEENLLAAIARREESRGRILWTVGFDAAQGFLQRLESLPEVKRVEIAGSLRRHLETVHDVDLIAAVEVGDREVVMNHFTTSPEVDRILGTGNTKSSVVTRDEVQVDLRAVSPEEFPFALHHFTGSKEHNTALRSRARKAGLSMSEWGVFREGQEQSLPAKTEEEVFALVGLPWIAPELREHRGEIEAAESGSLPELVESTDLRGVFHVHTTASDGRNSLREMLEGARTRGYEYVGISEHSQSASYANGLSPERLRAQRDEIETLRAEFEDITIFHGLEADILPDGELDTPDELLAELDFVIAAVHTQLDLDSKKTTERLVRAVRHPLVTILAHPTGRLLLRRGPSEMDLEQVLSEAAEHGVILELNSGARRLDLDWRQLRRARELGAMIGIFPDAHDVEAYDRIPLGVAIARKGWLTRDDVFNCHSARDVTRHLETRRERAKASKGTRS